MSCAGRLFFRGGGVFGVVWDCALSEMHAMEFRKMLRFFYRIEIEGASFEYCFLKLLSWLHNATNSIIYQLCLCHQGPVITKL